MSLSPVYCLRGLDQYGERQRAQCLGSILLNHSWPQRVHFFKTLFNVYIMTIYTDTTASQAEHTDISPDETYKETVI